MSLPENVGGVQYCAANQSKQSISATTHLEYNHDAKIGECSYIERGAERYVLRRRKQAQIVWSTIESRRSAESNVFQDAPIVPKSKPIPWPNEKSRFDHAQTQCLRLHILLQPHHTAIIGTRIIEKAHDEAKTAGDIWRREDAFPGHCLLDIV